MKIIVKGEVGENKIGKGNQKTYTLRQNVKASIKSKFEYNFSFWPMNLAPYIYPDSKISKRKKMQISQIMPWIIIYNFQIIETLNA